MIRFKFLDIYGKIRYLNVKEENIMYDCGDLIVKISNQQFDKIDKYGFKLKLEEYSILNGVKYLSFISDNKYVTYEREL